MEQLALDQSWRVAYLPDQKRFLVKWFANVDETNYHRTILEYAELSKKYQPHTILIDLEEANYGISPEMQAWSNEQLEEAYASYQGLRKVAFIVSHDIFTAVSVEQLVEDLTYVVQVQYFESYDKALKWLDA